VKIEMNEEDLKFLRELAHEIKTQDNRATRSPYYYTTRIKRWRVANEDYSSGKTKKVWVEHLTGDYSEYDTKFACLKGSLEYGWSKEKIREALANDNICEVTLEEYEEDRNVFLTEKAYKENMELDGHNLKRVGECYSYLHYASRNPEMERLLEIILKFDDKKTEEEK